MPHVIFAAFGGAVVGGSLGCALLELTFGAGWTGLFLGALLGGIVGLAG